MDDEALLAEIRTNPDDDAPRLVYADLLTARGDPRGEFITLQIQKPDDPRIDELWNEHAAQWIEDAGVIDDGRGFVRGFPDILTVTVDSVASIRRALATLPITTLGLSGEGDLVELFASPELAQVRVLEFAYCPFDRRAVKALAVSPNLGALEELRLHGAELTAPSIQVLAPRLLQLRGLSLTTNNLGLKGMRALAASRMPRLERLGIGEAISAEGVTTIVESPIVDGLTRLSFPACDARADGAKAIALSSRVGNVRELHLDYNKIGVDGADALGNSTALASLEVLGLQKNELGHAGVDALARGTGLPKLTMLYLPNNGIGTGLFDSRWCDGVEELELTGEELKKRFPHRPNLTIIGQPAL